MVLAVHAVDFRGFFIGQVFNPLLCPEMEFTPYPFVFIVIKAERMLAKEVHIPERSRNSPVAHHNGDLVEAFWQKRPEIPVVLRTAPACPWIALYRTVEVGKIMHVPDKEGRRVVSHQIPVPLLRVELGCNAADIAFAVCRPAFPGKMCIRDRDWV